MAGLGGEFQPWRPQGKHSILREVSALDHTQQEWRLEIEKEFQEFTGRSNEEK